MRKALLVLLIVFSFNCYSQDAVTKPLSIGETISFGSKILGEQRTLNIYLPEGYHQNDSVKYTVMYLLDGSYEEDFLHVAGLLQFHSFSWINTVRPTILVGIANVDRKRDFTFPTSIEKDKSDFPTTGGSERFMDFLSKEVFPLVQSRYKVVTDSRTIVGQSLGGLLATEILIKHPYWFTDYIIISPSLWWDNESLLTKLDKNAWSKRDIKTNIYIGVGKEGEKMENDAKQLHQWFLDLNNTKINLKFGYFEKRDHGDVMYEAMNHALESLYKK